MAIKCPQCGAEYDVTLFTFGRSIHCNCGTWVDLAVAWRLRRHELRGRVIHLKVRFADFTKHQLRTATRIANQLADALEIAPPVLRP